MVLSDKISDRKIILASSSPRRHQLLAGLGISFEVCVRDTAETYPPDLYRHEIPLYLCRAKAAAFSMDEFPESAILITADTVVWIDEKILNKPPGREEAIAMVKTISGRTHEVFTGVCLRTGDREHSFHAESKVGFRQLTDEEIVYYIDHCRPYDKAGAYGIQEWIGYTGIERIEGSFYNVMGLPTQKLYVELMKFIS